MGTLEAKNLYVSFPMCHMGTLEAVELGHAREVTRLGHPDICYHEITNPNINLVHFLLQPKNLKCTSLAIQCQNGLSVIIRL